MSIPISLAKRLTAGVAITFLLFISSLITSFLSTLASSLETPLTSSSSFPSSITTITSPTFTIFPASGPIFIIVPSAGDGSSTVTFSVIISTNG